MTLQVISDDRLLYQSTVRDLYRHGCLFERKCRYLRLAYRFFFVSLFAAFTAFPTEPLACLTYWPLASAPCGHPSPQSSSYGADPGVGLALTSPWRGQWSPERRVSRIQVAAGIAANCKRGSGLRHMRFDSS